MKIVSYNIAKCVQTKIDHVLRMNADLYILPECADQKSIVLTIPITMRSLGKNTRPPSFGDTMNTVHTFWIMLLVM